MGRNLLANSLFLDINADGTPDSFTKIGNGTLAVSTTPLRADMGGNCLSITGSTQATGIYQTLNAIPGEQYTVGFYHKCVLGGYITATITQYAGTLELLSQGEYLKSDKEIKFKEGTFTLLPNADSFKVSIVTRIGSDVILIGYPCVDIGDSTADAVNINEYEATGLTVAQRTKLEGIETAADVTDATNVNSAGATMNADTTLAGNGYFLDEDTMTSDDATKVPSQQSVKAYVATALADTSNRMQVAFTSTIDITAGSSGVIPFPTRTQDVGNMWPMTLLSDSACDTDTALHYKDADGTDWTTIDALLAPVKFPVLENIGSEWAIADTVAAHDITLSKDIFQAGTENGRIIDMTCHIATTGFYFVNASCQIATTEADKNYKIEIVSSITSPVVKGINQVHTSTTGALNLNYSGVISLTAGNVIYVKVTHDGASAVTIGNSVFSVVKL